MEDSAVSLKQKAKEIYRKIKGVKNIEIILACVACVIVLVVYFAVTTKKKTQEAQSEGQEVSQAQTLEEVLSCIKGAGKTRVMITYDGEGSIVPAETVNSSSTVVSREGTVTEKTTENKNTVIVTSGGQSAPIVLQKVSPEIIGVIVVSQGAGDPAVAVRLIRAVRIATGVTEDKITVFEME